MKFNNLEEFKPSLHPNGQFVVVWEFNGEVFAETYICHNSHLEELLVFSPNEGEFVEADYTPAWIAKDIPYKIFTLK